MALTDRELADRFPDGDDAVINAVYGRFSGPVYTVAMSILGDATRAADVVQATFVKAWQASHRFDPHRELGPWLYTIARRQAIDVYRRERRTEPSDPSELDVVELPPSLERTWEAWQVRLALDQLPAEERDVVRMSWYEGLTHPEIADRLSVPIGTVKSRSHRAHRRLATTLSYVRDANRNESPSVGNDGSRHDGADSLG